MNANDPPDVSSLVTGQDRARDDTTGHLSLAGADTWTEG